MVLSRTDGSTLPKPASFRKPSPDEEICITGIAGYFPECNSVKELEEQLFNKVDLITDDDRRWRNVNPEIPHRTGKVNKLENFDASFFGIDFKEAHCMDAPARLLLERVYECLIDAGVNPSELLNTKTGVFAGHCFPETAAQALYAKMQINEYGITGYSESMAANRISHWLGLKGPSYAIDTACSSSMYALEHAYKAILNGQCDSAIVCSGHVCLHPCTALQFNRLGVLAADGKCKCFDKRGDGYARSEAIVACYLQKAKESKRVHAKLVHAKTNCDGYKVESITYPSGKIQKQLLDLFYKECGVNPISINYVEAHATGTFVGDPEEVSVLCDVYCRDREGPLYVGSVKSNLGHPESTSGLNSIAKACIIYNTGKIPPTIHYKEPRPECESLIDGRIKVVTEILPWESNLLALNSFGFGGANSHILLSNCAKAKVNKGLPADDIPRLVCVSARTESGVAKILDDLESRTVDVEEIRLWHSVFERNIPGHHYRGYVLLESTPQQAIRLARDVREVSHVCKKRDVCFKYTDLGASWSTIGKQLMVVPTFAAAIQRCSKALNKKCFNLNELFDEDCSKQNDYSLVGAIAVYIGLTDVLNALGIEADFATGVNVGELCYAYVDGCISAEQAILAAYDMNVRLSNLLKEKLIIIVEMDYDAIIKIVPNTAQIKYDEDRKCCIIVGPASEIKTFAKQLTARNVPVQFLGANSPEFSRCSTNEDALLLSSFLKDIIPTMNHPERWLSQTSEIKSQSNDVIVIEIGVHEKEQRNYDSTLPVECLITMCNENKNNVHFILSSLGRLYQLGVNPRVANIYPAVSFPVSQGTPFLSHLIEWDHKDEWDVFNYDEKAQESNCFGRKEQICIKKFGYEYLSGHTIDGRLIYPATAYIILVWETFGNLKGRMYQEMSVVFEDVCFHKATHVPKDGTLNFKILICSGNGKFEITDDNDVSVVTGIIREKGDLDVECKYLKDNHKSQGVMMNTKDFYKELNIRGYEYKDLFRGVRSCSVDGTHGTLAWNSNWVTFLDTLLQTNIVAQDTRLLYVPTRIVSISINAIKHKQILMSLKRNNSKEQKLPFKNVFNIELSSSGGVEIRGLHVTAISKKPPKGIPVYEKNVFIPNYGTSIMSVEDVLRSDLQLIHENKQIYKFKTLELVDEEYKVNNLKPISEKIADVLADLPLVQSDMLVICDESLTLSENITVVTNKKIASESNNVLFIGANLLMRPKVLEDALATLKKGCFVLTRESTDPDLLNPSNRYDILTSHNTGSEYIALIHEKVNPKPTQFLRILTEDSNFSWIDDVKRELTDGQKLVLYSENEPVNGLLGLVNCLRREPGGESVYGLLIADANAPRFNPDCKFYKEHLDKGLALNVFKNGQWGTYRHLLLEELKPIPVRHAYSNTATLGDISSLRWFEGKHSESGVPTEPGHSLVEVYCSALNFRDSMVALGKVTVEAVARGRLSQECVQGIEISGRLANGTRVMGFVKLGITNLAEGFHYSMWPILDEWTLQEAATIPVAYCTVYSALILIGKMKRGERILIHAGSGGVGQAAINVALRFGLEVFTTVGSPAKRAFIKRLFPQIKDSHIGNSRDTSFEMMIQRETNGEGVDLVLNSLSEDILQASVQCLRNGGRFLEIGKYDITKNTRLEMSVLKKEVSFQSIMLDYLTEKEGLKMQKELHKLVLQGILSGAVRPLTFTTFEKHEIEPAYRYMVAGKHIGKIVIKIREEESHPNVKPSPLMIDAVPRLKRTIFQFPSLVLPIYLLQILLLYMCNQNKVYVLIGGLGGFGLELADWLVLRGARKLVMSSRRGISNGYQALRIRIWESYGVQVQISTYDVSTESGCAEMLKMAATLGPVRAVFNLAVILNDAVFQNQTAETFATSFKPKASTTIHLDKLTRTLCPELKDFVIFSSVSCGRGNAGQTNYGFSNSVMERICEERKSVGLPALAIQWGAVGDVGLVADMQEENIQLEIGGTLQQRIISCLQSMDKFLKQDSAIVSSIVVAEKRNSSSGSNSIVDAIASILGISDLKTISQQAPLSEMGMDSVMAVEIKQTLERDYEIFLSAREIRMITFAKLKELTATDVIVDVTAAKEEFVNSNEAMAMGLDMLVKNFGDEKLANEPFVFFNSAASNNNSDNLIFLVPGLASYANIFETLCSNLDARTCVLQLGLDVEETKLEQMVTKLHKIIKSQLHPGEPFVLLGYSFGTLPLLELAAILENEGHEGLVICLDGSLEYLQMLAKTYFYSIDDNQLENHIICHSLNVGPNHKLHDKLLENLAQIKSFDDKIKCAADMFPLELEYSEQFLISIAKITFNRIKILFDSNPIEGLKISSPIVLVRCKKLPIESEEDYGLSKFTKSGVTVHYVDDNHTNIIDNEQCAHIVNKMLYQFYDDSKNKMTRPVGTK